MTRGNHLPDFHWGDGNQSSFIDWAAVDTTLPPTTLPSTTAPPTTEPPITVVPSGQAGVRVAGGLMYRSGLDQIVGYFWAELGNGQVATMPLQPPLCALAIYDELGNLVGGGVAAGRRDIADDARVRFVIQSPGLIAGTNYIAIVTLESVDASTVGPRTIPMPVA